MKNKFGKLIKKIVYLYSELSKSIPIKYWNKTF